MYSTSEGIIVGLCLRVEYRDHVLYVSNLSEGVINDALALLESWPSELLSEPALR